MAFARVLLVLVALTACSYAQLCSPGGQVDSFQTSMCNCFSGYAPSTLDALDCAIRPKCAPAIMQPDVVSQNPPKKPKTKFALDTLEIVQQVPIVQGRKAAWLQFMIPPGFPNAGSAGLQTCQYPGPLWNKTVNGLDCVDEYRAAIPWSQNSVCGFVKNVAKSINNTVVYTTTLVTSVIDTYKTGATTIERLSTTSYLVSVSFLAQKTFNSGTFSVSMPDIASQGVLSQFTVSNSVYNPADGSTMITFLTTAQWPYSLDTTAANLATAFQTASNPVTGAVVSISNVVDSTLGCTADVRSACTQEWTVVIGSAAGCISNLEGTYNFALPVLCRDLGASAVACPSGPSTVPVALNVAETDLCDDAPVDTSLSNHFTLSPFSDADYSVSSLQYQTGDFVYWTFEVSNPLVSIKSITLNTISLTLQGSSIPDTLYNSALGGLQAVGSNVNLVVSEPTGVVPAGQTGTLTFSFQLLRGELTNTVEAITSSNLEANIITTVVADIVYYGNNRRSVLMELSSMNIQSAASDSKAIRVVASESMEAKEQTYAQESSPSSAHILSALSCVFFLVLAALF